jgi:hypothetical protein
MSYPKYEKVDEHNIRVIVEAPNVVSLSKLLENEQTVAKKIEELQTKLKYIREVIEEEKKLGVVLEVIVNKPKKELVSED